MGFVLAPRGATERRAELGDRAVPLVETPIARLVVRSPRLDHLVGEEHEPRRDRIRSIVREADIDAGRLIPMARMVRAANGGPLRPFSGGLGHENGWISLRKGRGLQHWEGVAQRALLVRSEGDFVVERVGAEALGLDFEGVNGIQRYTADVEVIGADGSITVWEVKRDERDITDEAQRQNLAIAAEIFRLCDIGFGIIFRDEIFESRVHRANAELFAARAFVSVNRAHLDRLEAHAMTRGAQSTYGALAEALEPSAPNFGRALVQALTVRRRVQIDLTARLRPDTPLVIH